MEHFSTNPGSMKGPVSLVDDQGTRWVLHRKGLDLRVVRRLIRDAAVSVVWGDMGGLVPLQVADAERPEVWERIKREYFGPGGIGSYGRYLAHEFRAEPSRRLLYIENYC
ncbi:hypothetical protein [Kitasatospora sp. NPDC004289]